MNYIPFDIMAKHLNFPGGRKEMLFLVYPVVSGKESDGIRRSDQTNLYINSFYIPIQQKFRV